GPPVRPHPRRFGREAGVGGLRRADRARGRAAGRRVLGGVARWPARLRRTGAGRARPGGAAVLAGARAGPDLRRAPPLAADVGAGHPAALCGAGSPARLGRGGWPGAPPPARVAPPPPPPRPPPPAA